MDLIIEHWNNAVNDWAVGLHSSNTSNWKKISYVYTVQYKQYITVPHGVHTTCAQEVQPSKYYAMHKAKVHYCMHVTSHCALVV